MAVGFRSPPKRAGISQESLTGTGGLGDFSGGTGRFGRPSWRDGRGQKALPESQERLGGSGEVGSPYQWVGMGRKAQQVGWERQEAFLERREGLGGPLERVGKSWLALPEGWEVSEGPTRGRMASGGPPAWQVELGGLPSGLGGVGRPS